MHSVLWNDCLSLPYTLMHALNQTGIVGLIMKLQYEQPADASLKHPFHSNLEQ